MTSNNNDATRALLAEIARLREDILHQGIIIKDIDVTLAMVYSEMRAANRVLRRDFPIPPAED